MRFSLFFIFIVFLVLSFSLVSALNGFGIDDPTLPKLNQEPYARVREVNYSLVPTVNSSDFWDDLDTSADISTGDLTDDNTYVEVAGDTMTGDLDIDNSGSNSEITIHSGDVNLNASLIFEEGALGRWRLFLDGLDNNFYFCSTIENSKMLR